MTYYEDLYFPAPCEIQSLYNRGWTVNRLSKLCYDMLPECEQKKDHSANVARKFVLSVVYDLNFDKEGDENGEITGSAKNGKPGLAC